MQENIGVNILVYTVEYRRMLSKGKCGVTEQWNKRKTSYIVMLSGKCYTTNVNLNTNFVKSARGFETV